MVYYHLSRYDEAIQTYKELIRIAPKYTEAHYELGSIYGTIGDKQSALDEYRILEKLSKRVPATGFEKSHYQRRAKELLNEIETGNIEFSHYGSCTG